MQQCCVVYEPAICKAWLLIMICKDFHVTIFIIVLWSSFFNVPLLAMIPDMAAESSTLTSLNRIFRGNGDYC